MRSINSIIFKVDEGMITHCCVTVEQDCILLELLHDDDIHLHLLQYEELPFSDHPELFELHDGHGFRLQELNNLVAGLVSDFADQSPTTTDSAHH